MPNFKLEELLSKSNEEIRSIAQSLGIKTKQADSQQDIAYMIIDEQAIQNSQVVSEPHRSKRPRIGEPAKKDNSKKKVADKDKEPAAAPDTTTATATQPATPAAETQPEPKRRGRPRKSPTPQPENETAATTAAQPETTPDATAEATTAPKRRGRPRKDSNTTVEPAATAASLFDDVTAETTMKEEDVATPGQATESVEQTTEEATATKAPAYDVTGQEESDFIILQDVPSVDSIDTDTPSAPSEQQSAGEGSATSLQTAEDTDSTPAKDDASQGHKSTPAPQRSANHSYDFGEAIIASGVLEITPEGQGYLRSADYNYLTSPDDIFVSPQQIKLYGLKMGDVIEGPVRAPRENEKVFTLLKANKINGLTPEKVRDRLSFEHLTPLFPDQKFQLCKGDGSDSMSARVVDLFAPIGKGQRALLVAQPKTGKTMLMKSIANAIAANHPEAYLMMLLIDERPEEVTDMARTVNAEVIASTFDEPASNHVKIAGIVLEKAKRMVECGHDVVIFLDSITRLARAYNTVAPASGKILTGGVDANALQKPKRFFGAARNIEGGGSLTIIATALIDTGSRMDEVIFEEFKGTGNMELQLDRTLSNKRIFPAVNCVASSTRRDDLLHDKMTLDRMWVLRNHIAEMTAMEAMTFVKERLERCKNNEEFLLAMNS